jgi:predicted NBD/HSP70 family sugar kinase
MSRLAGSAKLLRAMNSSATLAHLLQAGQLTRAELRERTGLSKPTSSEMLRLLTDAGLAVVTGRTAGGLGPTAEIYAPNGDAAYAVAVSIRDTLGADRPGLATAICDLNATLRDRAEVRIDFARVDPGAAVARAVVDACARAGADPQRVRHVQVGVPGSYDRRTDVLRYVDVAGWDRPGILAEIRAGLDLPADAMVAIENDVKLATIAERHRGVAAGAESFSLLWLGTGVGLATDLGGTVLRGSRGGAGEIGYLPLCGGHAPDWVGGAGDLQDLLGGDAVCALAAECGITAATPGDAVSAAVAGGADQFLQRLAKRIAFALNTVVAVLDPPLVVLAGEVAQAGGERLRDAVAVAMESASTASAATHAEPRNATAATHAEPRNATAATHAEPRNAKPSATPPKPRSAAGAEPRNADTSGRADTDVQIAVTAVDDDAVLLGGLDAGLTALHESLISSLAQPSD